MLAGLVVVSAVSIAQAPTTLKGAYKGLFHIGAAINELQIMGADTRGDELLATQFDSISPENVLKWERVHPGPDKYNFELPDKYVAFGEKNHMFIVGHCLVWHSQVPSWVFQGENGQPVDRETLLKRLHDHIATVVGRYKGRIQAWDVVNEALNDDGTLRQSQWLKIIGDDFIIKAFQFAHEADPQAQLNYNDYSLENEAKRKGGVELIRKLLAQGIPVTAVGLQGHYRMDWPGVEDVDASIAAFQALGVKVNITELDVDVLPRVRRDQSADVSARAEGGANSNPYTAGLPAPQQQALADRYAALFGVFLKHRDAITRVTFWGVTDRTSWLNDFPARGRTNYPLLFDREGKPKPAFDAVVAAARASR